MAAPETKEETMLLATTTVENYDRFAQIFSTKGAEKRALHGSKGSRVYRDPNEADRVWVVFDWDPEGWQKFASDPDVPGIMQEAGHKGRPVPGVGFETALDTVTCHQLATLKCRLSTRPPRHCSKNPPHVHDIGLNAGG
jgi:hypothetical protein